MFEALNDADAIVVGCGAGLSASGGLNYGSKEVFNRMFPQFKSSGATGIYDHLTRFWNFNVEERRKYWAVWATHIYTIRFKTPVLEPYKRLSKLLKNKNYFIINTNADGQLEKSGIDMSRVFSPQGDYKYLQCSTPCSNQIYEDEKIIQRMVENMPNPYTVREEDIPRCPVCGGYLVPNLRKDENFVELPHMKQEPFFSDFIRRNKNKKIVFLELGVGFNSPGVIRFPFEMMCFAYPQAKLIRVNTEYPEIPVELDGKGISVSKDITEALSINS